MPRAATLTQTTGFANPSLSAKAAIKETLQTTMHPPSSPNAVFGVRLVLSGACLQKMGRKCGILKNKVGEVIPEPVASVPYSLGETEVSRLGGNTQALGSLTQETPATAQA